MTGPPTVDIHVDNRLTRTSCPLSPCLSAQMCIRDSSGVILSQLFRGFTKSIKEEQVLDIPVLTRTSVSYTHLVRHTAVQYRMQDKPLPDLHAVLRQHLLLHHSHSIRLSLIHI